MEIFKKSSRVDVIKCAVDIFPHASINLQQSSLVVTSFLASKGADDGQLRYAARCGHESIVRYLIEIDGRSNNPTRNVAFQCAAYRGHLSIVKYLVAKGANVHSDDDHALRWAASYGHEAVVRYLVENGANVHAKDDDAVCTAAYFGHDSVVKCLIEHGANIHVFKDCPLRGP